MEGADTRVMRDRFSLCAPLLSWAWPLTFNEPICTKVSGPQLPTHRKHLRKLLGHQEGHILQCLFRPDGVMRVRQRAKEVNELRCHAQQKTWACSYVEGPLKLHVDYPLRGGRCPSTCVVQRSSAFPTFSSVLTVRLALANDM